MNYYIFVKVTLLRNYYQIFLNQPTSLCYQYDQISKQINDDEPLMTCILILRFGQLSITADLCYLLEIKILLLLLLLCEEAVIQCRKKTF